MTQRGKVGQNPSNALRSYNRVINTVTEQCDKYPELSAILGRNLKMAVVSSNTDGYVKYLGDEMFVNIIADKCEEELLHNSALEAAPKTTERAVLPKLPPPVSSLTAKDMQHIIPNVMRNLRGGGYVKWDKQESKPAGWPEDVVYANPKQRPQQQNSGVRWLDCLRKITTNMYSHHGYDPVTYVVRDDDSAGEDVEKDPHLDLQASPIHSSGMAAASQPHSPTSSFGHSTSTPIPTASEPKHNIQHPSSTQHLLPSTPHPYHLRHAEKAYNASTIQHRITRHSRPTRISII